MNNEIPEELSISEEESQEIEADSIPEIEEKGWLSRWSDALLQMGLGESILRVGTSLLSLAVIGVVVWLIQMFYTELPEAQINAAAAQEATPIPAVDIGDFNPVAIEFNFEGIPRIAKPFTNIPSRPRQQITTYTVQDGDSVFGIAEKYGLDPQTILWGNYNVLLDDPHALQAGQELTILPVTGTYYEWQAGDGLNGVASFFGVAPEEIINFPGNNMDLITIGDFNNPNIQPGTMLIVPGGKRAFTTWGAPLGVTREDPALARVLGPGACDPVIGGAVGYGNFVYPTNKHFLSGYNYSPESNHWGIDLAGSIGEGVYATDAGVVVYSGLNNYGYGIMIIIDHGNGFQSLYAHLSATYRFCGQSVGQGEGIGALGSTGRSSGSHLHFEIMTTTYKINPWDVLPPP
ncbi:MAG: M23 family metallopeptidase [Anaerolineae bacterium]|nr:M23 family metallopeptidase [Anaerolineae bacterium]MDK1080519.1 M23 family metallopeptidase [Anaerolineae bacterium]MDK1118210.1 M23 family metallopeptidase [Anaerolineae bacterium]